MLLDFVKKELYDGEWCENEKHRFGKLMQSDGGVYEGNWVRDVREDYGTYVFPNDTRYGGAWKSN